MQIAIGLGIGMSGAMGGVAAVAPATPTLGGISNGETLLTHSGEVRTLTATSTDGDLDRIDWVLDPGTGSETVVATDSASPYSQSWTITGTTGSHTLVARAVRGALSTDSASITVTFSAWTLTKNYYFASGTFTKPSKVVGLDGTPNYLREEALGAGGGGTAASSKGGGGGAFAGADIDVSGSSSWSVTVGTSASNADGGDSSGLYVVAKGGKSGANGGAGGAAASCTGSWTYDGGAAGATNGGAAAGSTSAASTTTPGDPGGTCSNAAGIATTYRPGVGGRTTSSTAGSTGMARYTYRTTQTSGYSGIQAIARGRSTSANTSHTFTLPSGSGGRLILFVTCNGIPTISVSGWTGLTQRNESTSTLAANVFHIVSTGSEGTTISLTSSGNVQWEVWRVKTESNGTPGAPEWTATDANGTNADPPAHTPSGGNANYIMAVLLAQDPTNNQNISAIPTGYDNFDLLGPRSSTHPRLSLCTKLVSGTSENPGTFTTGTGKYIAGTISIPPS